MADVVGYGWGAGRHDLVGAGRGRAGARRQPDEGGGRDGGARPWTSTARCPSTPTSTRWSRGRRFELDEAGDQDPDTWAELGGEQALRELRRRSIVYSGNLATNLVIEQTGSPPTPPSCRRCVRMISDQPATDAGIVNAASARQWGSCSTGSPRPTTRSRT